MEPVATAIAGVCVGLVVLATGYWHERIVRWLIGCAVQRLPYDEERRKRYEEEWTADCLEPAGRIFRIFRALDTLRAASIICKVDRVVKKDAKLRRLLPSLRPEIYGIDPVLVSVLEGSQDDDTSASVDLMPREKECLRWVKAGKTASEIGLIMGISERTVQFHIYNAMKKLGASSHTSAVMLAIKRRLI